MSAGTVSDLRCCGVWLVLQDGELLAVVAPPPPPGDGERRGILPAPGGHRLDAAIKKRTA